MTGRSVSGVQRAHARREATSFGGHQQHSQQSRPSRKLSRMDYCGAVALVSGWACLLYWNTLEADFAYDDR